KRAECIRDSAEDVKKIECVNLCVVIMEHARVYREGIVFENSEGDGLKWRDLKVGRRACRCTNYNEIPFRGSLRAAAPFCAPPLDFLKVKEIQQLIDCAISCKKNCNNRRNAIKFMQCLDPIKCYKDSVLMIKVKVKWHVEVVIIKQYCKCYFGFRCHKVDLLSIYEMRTRTESDIDRCFELPAFSSMSSPPVENRLCEGPVPNRSQLCHLPCPIECQVSPWGAWGPCTYENCDDQTAKKGFKLRRREIVNEPSGGPGNCPHLVEAVPCEDPACWSWRVLSLEQCVPEGRGVMWAGNAGCSGPVCQQHWCPDAPRPSTMRSCQLSCKRDCIVSPFSDWTSCPDSCDPAGESVSSTQSRRRVIVQQPSNGGQECPDVLEEQRECDPPKTCPGFSGVVPAAGRDPGGCGPVPKVGALHAPSTQRCLLPCQDDCQLSPWSKFSPCTADCVGVRSRKRALIGYIEEACIIPCPSDCKLSEWSNWSRCSKSCGSGVKVRSKWLREKPYNGGRPCPKLDHINQAQVYEMVPCQSDCSQYVWVAEPWSVWKVSNVDLKENCGEGVQTRKVRCMLNTIDGPSEAVDDYLCDPEEMPLGARESRLPCPEDCVLNDWGPWSRCSLPCTRTRFRERTAYVLRSPSVGRQCPNTTDREPCSLNLNCFNYFYNITEWSTCQLSPSAVCGPGLKTRMLDCVRSDGKSVDMRFCEELQLEKRWQMNMSCTVECPVNCQLSEWSSWSQCSQTCGLEGRMWRSRWVVQASQGDGRPCPSHMQQWKPCPVRPCYSWRYSQWSECRVENVVCGAGLRFRNLTCWVSDGSAEDPGAQVEEELCSGLDLEVEGDKMISLKEPCTLPCPGECYLMEWSDWSPCVSICVKEASVEFGSVQVRSRAVLAQEPENLQQCPDQAWESQTCIGGDCYEYKWKSSVLPGSTRPIIWCQRSDGVNVTGGCPPLSPGADSSSCDPPCLMPRSFCSQLLSLLPHHTHHFFPSHNLSFSFCLYDVVAPSAERPVRVRGGLHGAALSCGTAAEVHSHPRPGGPHSPGQWSGGGDQQSARAHPELHHPAWEGGRAWYLQPYGAVLSKAPVLSADGKLKMWVYGVAAGALVLLIFIVSMIYLACKKPKRPPRQRQQNNNRLKPLTLAYDGDTDISILLLILQLKAAMMPAVVLLVFLAPLLICCRATDKPMDCSDILQQKPRSRSGVYTVYPLGGAQVKFTCQIYVIQRRMDGSVNFYRGWDQYVQGFGDAKGEYWFGLEFMHKITARGKHELLVEMEDFQGNKTSARYSSFSVGENCDGYKLTVSGFTNGGAGDSLSGHNNMKFTTFDKDQDAWGDNCAKKYLGGFWYNMCHYTNPNGIYLWGLDNTIHGIGMDWSSWKGVDYSLKSVSFKIRPAK
ncbi:hypothetical protein WMY93_031614, partial [Mugilogobius chulae]